MVCLITKVDVMQKLLNLSEEAEPEIYETTRKFGTILENVQIDAQIKKIRFRR